MRNYSYGARGPVENAPLIALQFRLAHSYQCALVAIEWQRRRAIDRVYQHACPAEHAEHEAASAAAREAALAVRVGRSTGGEYLEADDDMKAETRERMAAAREVLDQARAREKVAREAWWAAKKAVKDKVKPRLKMCDRGAYARAKRAYNLAGVVGLAWGTRLKVGESVERAAKMTQKEGTLPHFPRFNGTGFIAVQLQGESGIVRAVRDEEGVHDKNLHGLDPAQALSGGDTRFRLELVDAATWQAVQGRSAEVGGHGGRALVRNGPRKGLPRLPLPQPKLGSKRSQARQLAIVRLRIGSEGRTPIWAAWPVVLHRPLPAHAPIKWVQMIARRGGAQHTEWTLMITADEPAVAEKTEGPTLAVNLGWRHLPDGGIRVAYAIGSDGHEEEVRVPGYVINGVTKGDSLRAIRDQRFEVLKKDLREWLDDESTEKPAWLSHDTAHLEDWRSPKRVVYLTRYWTSHRFAGDAPIYEAITAWLKKDRHLYNFEHDHRAQNLRHRRQVYRDVAARWATRYARIVVTDMDLRDFAEHVPPEEGARSKAATQRRTRFMAAPSELRAAVSNACSTRGCAFVEQDGGYKTQTCHACGVVFAFAAKQDLLHTCMCGARWDQDANHCKNLLTADRRLPAGDTTQKLGRWQKRRKPVAAAPARAAK